MALSPVERTRRASASAPSSPQPHTSSLRVELQAAATRTGSAAAGSAASPTLSQSCLPLPPLSLTDPYLHSLASSFIPTSVLGRLHDGQSSYLAELRRITTLFVLLPEHEVAHAEASVRQEQLDKLQEVVSTILVSEGSHEAVAGGGRTQHAAHAHVRVIHAHVSCHVLRR